MTHGRTYWWSKDAGWWRREWIVDLGEEFGAAGPAVIDWLSCEAKAQNDGGYVSAGVKSVARGCFVDPSVVLYVLSRSVTLGLLEEYEERDGRFMCRISGWRADQDRAGTAARKADQRARQSIDTGDQTPHVTLSHAQSRPVTECPPTGQDRTDTSTAKAVDAPWRSGDDAERDKATAEDRFLCRLFAELGRSNNPKLKIGNDATWLKAVRLMRERDGHTVEEIEQVIRWMFGGESEGAQFWGATIQSPSGLREHFGKVWGRMQQPARPSAQAEQISELDRKRLAGMQRAMNKGGQAA